MEIKLKRIYDDSDKNDGSRFLVDRLWPRGVSKEDANLDDWLKGITPSSDLRKWFDHDPEKWDEFKSAYREELAANQDQLDKVIQKIKDKEKVTFLYAAKDTEHTHAIVLKDVIKERMQSSE
ncbi:MAG TPA: DUF488 domain-containing protein [Balneolaceae bacterium]